MPTNQVKELFAKIEHMERRLTEACTDMAWVKRILIGAASIGTIAKVVSWIAGR